MRFGELLAKYRIDHGWSQEDLAEKSGIKRPFIGLLEQGRRSVKLKDAEPLARALGLEGSARDEFLDLANLTRSTDELDQMLAESRAQVKFLADLVGLGTPVTVNPDEAKAYGKEAAEKLAAGRRANQQLYERLMQASGKKKPPVISGVDEIPDSPLAPPAAPFAQRKPKRGRSK